MKIVSEELKQKFIGRINENMKIYEALIRDIDKAFLDYGREYFYYSKGKVTENYIMEHKSNMIAGVSLAEQKAFSDMVTDLEQLKAEYISESYSASTTTDPLEISFISKELEIMTPEELKEFYEENFADANKVRLFDIEVKRRSRSTDQMQQSEGEGLSSVKEQFQIRDKVTEKIEERSKVLEGMRQLSTNMLYLLTVKEDGSLDIKMVSYKDVLNAIQGKSIFKAPEKVSIFELMD